MDCGEDGITDDALIDIAVEAASFKLPFIKMVADNWTASAAMNRAVRVEEIAGEVEARLASRLLRELAEAAEARMAEAGAAGVTAETFDEDSETGALLTLKLVRAAAGHTSKAARAAAVEATAGLLDPRAGAFDARVFWHDRMLQMPQAELAAMKAIADHGALSFAVLDGLLVGFPSIEPNVRDHRGFYIGRDDAESCAYVMAMFVDSGGTWTQEISPVDIRTYRDRQRIKLMCPNVAGQSMMALLGVPPTHQERVIFAAQRRTEMSLRPIGAGAQ